MGFGVIASRINAAANSESMDKTSPGFPSAPKEMSPPPSPLTRRLDETRPKSKQQDNVMDKHSDGSTGGDPKTLEADLLDVVDKLQAAGSAELEDKREDIEAVEEFLRTRSEISLSNKNIISISQLFSLSDKVGGHRILTLDLSYNQITEMKSLQNLPFLTELNLSQNAIIQIDGITHLSKLRLLDLSSNQLQQIGCLEGLTSLQRLDFANNFIRSLEGLAIFGPEYELRMIDLAENRIERIEELHNLRGCVRLEHLTFSQQNKINMANMLNLICLHPKYAFTVKTTCPSVTRLDGQPLLASSPSSVFDGSSSWVFDGSILDMDHANNLIEDLTKGCERCVKIMCSGHALVLCSVQTACKKS